MKKKILRQLMHLYALTLLASNVCANVTTHWISESGDYSAGESVGAWQVLEYKDAVARNTNNVWSINGTSGGTVDTTGSSMMWFYFPGLYATVEFTQTSTSVAFMLNSDINDGLVNLYVDNTEVLHHFNMQTLPGTGAEPFMVGTFIVSGLMNEPHSVRIESAPDFAFADGRNDFHVYGAAAVSPVPAPAAVWMWIAGCGLLGAIALKKKREGKLATYTWRLLE